MEDLIDSVVHTYVYVHQGVQLQNSASGPSHRNFSNNVPLVYTRIYFQTPAKLQSISWR